MGTTLLNNWTIATEKANWGVQQAIKTALELVADEEIRMCWGSDVHEGAPCLINSINQMLSHNADKDPAGSYPEIVNAFDQLNASLGGNTDGYVSPIAAEIMLHYMGPLKPVPVEEPELTPEQFQEWAKAERALHGTPEGARLIEEVMPGDTSK